MLPHEDLQEFIKALRSVGEICEIGEPVSPSLEISEIADRVVPDLCLRGVALAYFKAYGVQDSES